MERFYPLFRKLGVTPVRDLVDLPGGTEVLIAGVRRATNTPPMRGGKRVVFISLDDGTGAVSMSSSFTTPRNKSAQASSRPTTCMSAALPVALVHAASR